MHGFNANYYISTKMKNPIYFLLCIFVLISCTGKNTYDIRFNSDDTSFDGYLVSVNSLTNKEAADAIDSAIISDGSFRLKGTVDTADWYMLVVSDPNGSKTLTGIFYLEGKLDVTIDNNQIAFAGGPVNNAYQAYITKYNEMTVNLIALNSKLMADPSNAVLQKQLAEAYQQFEKEFRLVSLKSIKANSTNPAGIQMLKLSASILEDADIENLLTMGDETFLRDPYVQALAKQLENAKRVAIGNPYIDMAMFSPDGDTVTLSNYVCQGCYVLIDFWASWCNPCIRELPNVLACYKKYHNKGFEVVGVSLDENGKDWEAAINQHQLPWPQMSDLSGWNSMAVSLYAFSSIPHTVLIDPNGTIVQKNLRGKLLEEKLEELLGK